MILAVDWVGVAKGLAAHRRDVFDAELLGDLLTELSPEARRRAADAVNDFTRTRMREDGFYRRIIPPLAISDADLDRAVDTDRPVLIIDRALETPPEPAGISIPFATLPAATFIRGPRYAVNFDPPVHNLAAEDELGRLLNDGGLDLRQRLADAAIDEISRELDREFQFLREATDGPQAAHRGEDRQGVGVDQGDLPERRDRGPAPGDQEGL